MIEFYDKETLDLLGTISQEQFQFMQEQLEEESLRDRDYYINRPTLDMFEQRGADPQLMALLRQALGNREDMEIVWRRG